MKIPFDIKYRPQLERGEYKVETGDGRPVKIISFELTDTNDCPIAAQFRLCAGTPVVYLFDKEGHYKGEGDSDYDLFIITPKQELTPFEDGLRKVCEEAVKEALAHPERTSEDFAKTHSTKLLDLAREELVDEWSRGLRDTQDRSGKAYNDGYQLGLERGYEALKDLPRWSKNAITRGCAAIDISGLTAADYIRREGKLLNISDLEKLPGFKEN